MQGVANLCGRHDHPKWTRNRWDAEYAARVTEAYEKQQRNVQLIEEAFKALGCDGWGRVDFIRDSSGEFFLIEVNTVPGMTNHSLVPMAASEVGISFDELVLRILSSVSYTHLTLPTNREV